MSVARIYTTNKSRKVWTCGKCRTEIPKGEKVLHFTVGFRGREQHRCGKPECFPKPSERESSLVSTIYAAQEDFDVSEAENLDDITAAVQNVIDACEEVVGEYEQNEMFEINPDLQERVDMITSAGEELESWADGLDDEPQAEDYEDFDEEAEDGSESFEDAHDAWLEDAREAAQEAVNNMDLP